MCINIPKEAVRYVEGILALLDKQRFVSVITLNMDVSILWEMITIHAKCIAYNQDVGGYTTYVFQNLNPSDWTNVYIMCTRFPNWENESFKLNDIGYLSYEDRYAGISKWYNSQLDTMIPYNYTFVQFVRFILDSKDENKEIFI